MVVSDSLDVRLSLFNYCHAPSTNPAFRRIHWTFRPLTNTQRQLPFFLAEANDNCLQGDEVHDPLYITHLPREYIFYEEAFERARHIQGIIEIEVSDAAPCQPVALVLFSIGLPVLIPAYGAYPFEAKAHLDRLLHWFLDNLQEHRTYFPASSLP